MNAPIVIVGDGALGTGAAEHLRLLDRDVPIQVISDDPHPSYFRAALTNFILGELRAEQLFSVPPDWYDRYNIERVEGRVARVDSSQRQVHTEDGRAHPYRSLVVGSGARARRSATPGAELDGVTVLRTFADAQYVLGRAKSGQMRHAAIVGGGPLGLEWAHGLQTHGVRVTLVLRKKRILERLLDQQDSDLVIHRLERAGVRVIEDEIVELTAGRTGSVRQATLRSGQRLDVDMVGYAIGNIANVAFLEGSGVEVERRGVVVDDHLRASVPDIWAGGDCAVVNGTNLGLWEPARKHGKRIARNLLGDPAPYDDRVHYSATRLFDLDYAHATRPGATPDDARIEVPSDTGRVVSRKLFFERGRLVGLSLLGEAKLEVRRRGRLLRRLIEAQVDVAGIQDRLLDPTFDLRGWSAPSLSAHQARTVSPTAGKRTANLRRSRVFAARKVARGAPVNAAHSEAQLLVDGHIVYRGLDGANLGRHPDNEVVLTGAFASSRHCRVHRVDGRWVVENRSSTNPVRVAGKATAERTPLTHGDHILIGEQVVVFHSHESTDKERRAPRRRWVAHLDGPDGIQDVDVDGVLRIGRDADTVDIPLSDDAISTRHCSLRPVQGGVEVHDLGSTNGTFVDGTRLGDEPVVVGASGEFRIGETTVTLREVVS